MILFLILCAVCFALLATMLPRTLRDAAEQKTINPTTEELETLVGIALVSEVAPEDRSDFLKFAEAWVRDQLATH